MSLGEQEKILQIKKEFEQLLKKENLTEMVTIESESYKLCLTLGDSLLFVITGYGSTSPLVDNDTVKNRSINSLDELYSYYPDSTIQSSSGRSYH